MRQATLCFLVKDGRICLGMKKRGFGEGMWNGFGGKILEGEAVESGAIRELEEESFVKVGNLEKFGEIIFTFPEVPTEKDWNQKVHIYLCRDWQGEPIESEEMRPNWFSVESIPFESMWDDDKYWLPLILGGNKILGEFSFDKENKVLGKSVRHIKDL